MMTKVELFNAKNAGKKIANGDTIKVVSIGQFADKDKDGHDVMVSCLKDENGDIYTTISGTIGDSLPMLDEILADEGVVTVKVNQNKSNNGREFFQLQII